MRKAPHPRRFIWELGDLQKLEGAGGVVAGEPDRGSHPGEKIEDHGRRSSRDAVK